LHKALYQLPRREDTHLCEFDAIRSRTGLGDKMKILLAIDNSEFSEAATEAVIEQSTPGHTEVHVFHVVDFPTNVIPEAGMYSPAMGRGRDAERKLAQALADKVASRLRSHGLRVTTAIAWGDPRSKIIEEARTWEADLIVIGSHGWKGLGRFLMGSVPEGVARHAPCSVQIVRVRKVA
jgi:nucleotide-binding universal stress UspA family protein